MRLVYVRLGLLAGLSWLLITACVTIVLAGRCEYELVKPLNEIATVAHDVRLHRRFDKRVQPLGIAELDRLGGDVNALLDELQGWQGHMENEHAMLAHRARSEEHTSELQSLMRISYAVFCLKKKTINKYNK